MARVARVMTRAPGLRARSGHHHTAADVRDVAQICDVAAAETRGGGGDRRRGARGLWVVALSAGGGSARIAASAETAAGACRAGAFAGDAGDGGEKDRG